MTKSTVCVYFLISGDRLNPEDVTEKLAIQPTKYWVKGDPIPEKKRFRIDSCWLLSTGDEEFLDVGEQLGKILTLLQGKKKVLVKLADEYELDYQFNIVIKIEEGVKPAINLDKTMIKELDELKAGLDIDLYIYS
ncbi:MULTISPECIES: DUF4279 domain-containing protein [Photorhabdus]|uniref:DUF4279 domain-containing protein n=1 Tax=Photorhabdus khanii NC19 TaxID=1004151 RepID=W3VE47_9GAMM|nr:MULTISPECIES: DUF4279 domain-containing protein [Photorhabdus]ETS33334.1 protein of unknown function (DUF4279) [Photorhabdus khanii NC19]OHV53953.1 hypothetical protein BB987_11290 [Photorhabdus temperata]